MMHSEYDGCKYNIGVDHGDCIEAIMVDDRRYMDIGIKHDKILHQIDTAIKQRDKIRKQLVCLLTGNHEIKLWRFGDIPKFIAQSLGVRHGDWTSIITYTDTKGKPVFKHYACHSAKRVISSRAGSQRQKRANEEIQLQRALSCQAGDCLLMSQGHVHQLIVVPPDDSLFLYSEGGHLKSGYTAMTVQQTGIYLHENLRWYAACGSFLRSRITDGVTYAEMLGYPPNQLGFLIARVRDYWLVGIDEVRIGGADDRIRTTEEYTQKVA